MASPEFILLSGISASVAVTSIGAWIETRLTDRLPEPDRSTLRRPVVDPNWEPGEGYDRH